jgi:S1-C subfamily serine protease
MSRLIGLALSISALLAAGFALAPAASGAEAHRVQIVRMGGAHLGVQLADVGKPDVARLKLSEERGALVKSVDSDTPAEKAGLKEEDVILRYQGEAVQGAAQLARLVRETPPGRTVSLEVSRGGAIHKLSATLEEGKGGPLRPGDIGDIEVPTPSMPPMPHMPPIPPDAFRWEDGHWGKGRAMLFPRHAHGPRRLGIEYQEVSGQLARFFRLPDERGLLVTSVDEDGPAAKGGLKAGDVILKFGGKDVRDADDLRHEEMHAASQEVTITVQREGKPLDLKLKLGVLEPRRDEETT